MTAFGTLEPGRVSRTVLALYAGASGDHNPMHIDLDYAKDAGLDDVFAHGMLSMGYLGRLVTSLVPQDRLIDFSVRFAAITPVNSHPICRAVSSTRTGKDTVLELEVVIPDGTVTLQGHATIRGEL